MVNKNLQARQPLYARGAPHAGNKKVNEAMAS
jgi:hypothetical protein